MRSKYIICILCVIATMLFTFYLYTNNEPDETNIKFTSNKRINNTSYRTSDQTINYQFRRSTHIKPSSYIRNERINDIRNYSYSPIKIDTDRKDKSSTQVSITNSLYATGTFQKEEESYGFVQINPIGTNIGNLNSYPEKDIIAKTSNRYFSNGNFPPFPNDPAPIGDAIFPLIFCLTLYITLKIKKQ